MFEKFFASRRAARALAEHDARTQALADVQITLEKRELQRKRGAITVIGTCEYSGYRGDDEENPDETFIHIMVFKLNGLAERSYAIEGHQSWEYNEDMIRDRSTWMNLGRLPDKAILADSDAAMRFKLFWGGES